MKKSALLIALISSPLFASDWVKSEDLNTYTSPDIVSGNLNAMIKTYEDGSLRFGLFLPYEKCYVSESYAEPFTDLYVLGGRHEFKLQCIGKNQAIVYSSNDVNKQIIDTLVRRDNLCLTIEDGKDSVKMCFSGSGVAEIQSSSKMKMKN
ncbi:hypothetical protein [Vibrio atlanticus]|uniref:Uncharacterized protein n=1 Tax=Vibrio atlanticus TaxID=693153 RepID=A0ABV4KQI5_9VIBR